MKTTIKQLVKPENGIEAAIVSHADFIEGASYGKPRSGHPEGKVIYHVKEVLDNIDKFYDSDDKDREELRLIALVHDTLTSLKSVLITTAQLPESLHKNLLKTIEYFKSLRNMMKHITLGVSVVDVETGIRQKDVQLN